MAEYNLKVKTVDEDGKSYTKTFTMSTQLGTNEQADMKELANCYAELTDYSTKSAQKITYTDVDLATE